MLDEVVSWLFWGVIVNIFFRLGRLYIRLLSMGRIRIESPTFFIYSAVTLIGLLISLGLLWIAIGVLA